MTDLKVLMQQAGATEIQTYIQSGNIIYDGGRLSADKWSKRIQEAIQEDFGFDVPIITLTQKDFLEAIELQPFDSEIERLHASFLSETPHKAGIEKLKELDTQKEEWEIIDKVFYLKCTGKYSDSKLTNGVIESKLKLQSTTRNWKTVSAIQKLVTA